MINVAIRDVSDRDLSAVARIYAHYVTNSLVTFDEAPPDLCEWQRRAADLRAREFPFLVLEDDGEIAGYAYVAPWKPKPAYRHTVENTIYLAPGKAGRGFGRALLGELLDRCAATEIQQIIAVVVDTGNGASMALHEAFGFKEAGRLRGVGFKHGQWLDTVLLQRSLDCGRERASEVRIVVDDLSGPEIAGFLAEHVREMRSITPAESAHALDPDELRTPEVTVWSAMDGDTLVGCAAIKRLDTNHAEVKSMRTAPGRMRSGIASLLLEHILAEARHMGFTRLSLETGATEFFLPARKLYEKFGFAYCEPFAGYQSDPLSVFMTREI